MEQLGAVKKLGFSFFHHEICLSIYLSCRKLNNAGVINESSRDDNHTSIKRFVYMLFQFTCYWKVLHDVQCFIFRLREDELNGQSTSNYYQFYDDPQTQLALISREENLFPTYPTQKKYRGTDKIYAFTL
ncbi:CLUMA_CG011058, isoform A [Clunio marinus]|uniref:CLUMA_CG011058, isoform A n=1 Tax=Clunio marinus TaxID=568069 RepID=A0A1J1IFA2_9DIPT|nr:CLUMA_CG011058, isoform A [Clunio marinus]